MIYFLVFFFAACMLFYGVYLILNYYYFTFKFPASNFIQNDEILPSVTILIPARNEEKYIGALLDDILIQDYPVSKVQVIIINDHSDDRTEELCIERIQQRTTWKLIQLQKPEGTAYKKAAISQAIQLATGDIILTTDADCRAGIHWIRSMSSAFKEDTGLISGPVCMWDDGSWFQQFQALEFSGLIAIGAGSMFRGNPNMCNGANLAYRKNAFFEVNGFEGIDHIASGDDELLMHKIHSLTQYEVVFQKDARAIVRTAPSTTFRQFVNQRIRWVSKSTHYKNSSITITMSLIYLAILGIPLVLIAVLAGVVPLKFLLIILGLKIIPEFLILYSACQFFGQKKLLRWFLPEQILHIPYILWAGMAGNLGKYSWKDRTVR